MASRPWLALAAGSSDAQTSTDIRILNTALAAYQIGIESDLPQSDELAKAMDRLPGDFRAVFMLRSVQQLSVQETAACLDIPRATVNVVFIARTTMQQMLNVHIESAGLHAFKFAGIVATVSSRLCLKDCALLEPNNQRIRGIDIQTINAIPKLESNTNLS